MSMLTRRHALATLAAPLLAQRRNAPRANVLLIVANDLSARMLGCYGNTVVKTPHLDRLARTGVRILDAFAASPAPPFAKTTLYSGLFPRQLRGGNAAGETLLSDILSSQGYHCGYLGAWGLGDNAQPGHGIQYASTLPDEVRQTNPDLLVDGKQTSAQGYLPELLTQRVSDFLTRRDAAKPFFLTLAFPSSGRPDNHPAKYLEMYANQSMEELVWEPVSARAARNKEQFGDVAGNLRKVAAGITALDDQVGTIIAKLRETKLEDNTLVVFTADQGNLLGRHGLWGDASASDPANLYEEVVRVPLIVYWLGKTPIELMRTELISATDFVPFVCESVQVDPPAGRLGRSFLPVVQNKPLPRRQPWPEMVFASVGQTEMARDHAYKIVVRNEGDGLGELYDLRVDPMEQTNQYANPEFITVRDRMASEVAAWRKKG